MIKAVIFDMDGLIFDSEPIAIETTLSLMKEYGVSVTGDTSFFLGLRNVDILKLMKKKYKINQPIDKMKVKMSKIFLSRASSIKLMPGFTIIKKLVTQQGWLKSLATSAQMANAAYLLKKHKLWNFFDVIVTAEAVKQGKPHPEVYKLAAKKLKVKPADCLVLEDSLNGLIAAKRAGMKCIVVPDKKAKKSQFKQADAIVKSLADINLGLIQRI